MKAGQSTRKLKFRNDPRIWPEFIEHPKRRRNAPARCRSQSAFPSSIVFLIKATQTSPKSFTLFFVTGPRAFGTIPLHFIPPSTRLCALASGVFSRTPRLGSRHSTMAMTGKRGDDGEYPEGLAYRLCGSEHERITNGSDARSGVLRGS